MSEDFPLTVDMLLNVLEVRNVFDAFFWPFVLAFFAVFLGTFFAVFFAALFEAFSEVLFGNFFGL